MADNCPWNANGKHIDGCGCNGSRSAPRKAKDKRAQQEAAVNAQKDRIDREESKKIDNFLRKHVRTNTYTPNPFPGVKLSKRGDGYYYYERE
jgi:hypothetical protein